jgi:hypothetical protein
MTDRSTPPPGARFSVRVPPALKAAVRELATDLSNRGLRTSESELVEMFVAEGVQHADLDVLEDRLRRFRREETGIEQATRDT